jgi:hypothetical protein
LWPSRRQTDRQTSPKKALVVVVVVVVLAVAAGQPEWPSTLQWEKYIQISILNANIIIIRLVYQNACPHNKTKRLPSLKKPQKSFKDF